MIADDLGYVSIHAPVMDAIELKGVELPVYSVSIHAPVMDAIELKGVELPVYSVSIHAPVMDAIMLFVSDINSACFNPRARDGRDITLCANLNSRLFQSTRP